MEGLWGHHSPRHRCTLGNFSVDLIRIPMGAFSFYLALLGAVQIASLKRNHPI
jgi:hypothetical protein